MRPVTRRARIVEAIAVTIALVGIGVFGVSAQAIARGHHSPSPAPTTPAQVCGTPMPTPTPTASSTPTTTPTPTTSSDAPVGNIGAFKQQYVENFNTTAAANGPFAKAYADSWQQYADGTGGMYYSSSQVSAHGGYMDVTLDGKHGAAGTFGTPDGAWSHVGGKFTIRARATGGAGNGVAVMLWPSSNIWADGEIDYPEGQFDGDPMAFHHSMVAGQEATAVSADTDVTWANWHTYSIEWIPGKSATYSVDGRIILTVTKNVPTTAHRYMFQVGNWGAAGHLDIDWVTTYDYAG